jgi:Phosphotransferase enzyme family
VTTRTWLDPAWRATAEAWATDRLAENGLAVDGPIEQPHVAPWATVLRLPTAHGPFWFKASAPGTAYEHRMFGVLSEVVPEQVLTAIATDVERAWSLLPDAGTRLRDRLEVHPDERFDRWVEVATDHARLQRALAPHSDRLIDLGVPDMRPRAVPEAAAALVESMDLDDDLRARARNWLPQLAAACETLAASSVPATVQQDDLHDGNVLIDGPTYRLVDWGDACISHPFGVFLILRISLAQRGEVEAHGPELRRVEDAYLSGFSDLAPLHDLRRELLLAEYVQSIARLCTWQRELSDASPEEGAQWRDALPGWFADLIDEPVP